MEENSLKKVGDKASGFVNGFRRFISRSSMLDLAVGVVIGGAFGQIVSSLVNYIIMPLVGVLLGGIDFAALSFSVSDAQINYGIFFQNIINFIIIAFCVFLFMRVVNQVNKVVSPQVEDKKVLKTEDKQLAVLKEIRDQLRK